MYGYTPRYFGVSESDTIAPVEMQEWLQSRQAITETARQHPLRAQHRMKNQADKHRSDRTFAVGDQVFLKMQPYAQLSLYSRANHKLAFKFYGPFQVLERIGDRAYKLDLPATSRLHPVFHVSQLKKFLPRDAVVNQSLPTPQAALQIPVQVLQRKVCQVGRRSIVRGLVQWSESSPADATWEDLEFFKQQFPRAPAWGQAGSQGGRIVSNAQVQDTEDHHQAATEPDTVHHPTSEEVTAENQASSGPAAGPTRVKMKPRWIGGPEWVR